jgi:hypothetical protein
MNIKTPLLLVLALAAPLAFAETDPSAQQGATEQPYAGEPVTVEDSATPLERAFREVQIGMERMRSDKPEDAEKVVCLKQKPTGSNISQINCATNRYWEHIRSNSLGTNGGFVGSAASGGNTATKNERVFTMSLAQYRSLEKQFGKLPKDMLSKL